MEVEHHCVPKVSTHNSEITTCIFKNLIVLIIDVRNEL